MDGTLVDNIPAKSKGFIENLELYKPTPIARPGMKEVLEYAFTNYKHVSIWTAGTRLWYNEVYEKLFKHAIPPGKNFHFVRTRNVFERYVPLKPLSMIYAQYSDYTPSNTIIVDDNPNTFRDNIENAEHIPSFFYDLLGTTPDERKNKCAEDIEIFGLIDRLKLRRRDYNRSILKCVLILFGKMKSELDSITVHYSELPDLDNLKIDQIKNILRKASPNILITTEHMSSILYISWKGKVVDPIVFDKTVFPDVMNI